MLRYFYSTLVLGLFLFYSFFTVVFSTPDNFFNITLLKHKRLFNTFFYQNWGFFAPPPKSNDRLYFIFLNKNKSDKSYIFEAIEPILKEKHENAPFNGKSDLLDYLISNSINQIKDQSLIINDNYKIEKKRTNFQKYLIDNISETNPYKSIINYSRIIALKNKINWIDYEISFKITHIKINKFIDRNKINLKTPEEIIFESKP